MPRPDNGIFDPRKAFLPQKLHEQMTRTQGRQLLTYYPPDERFDQDGACHGTSRLCISTRMCIKAERYILVLFPRFLVLV